MQMYVNSARLHPRLQMRSRKIFSDHRHLRFSTCAVGALPEAGEIVHDPQM